MQIQKKYLSLRRVLKKRLKMVFENSVPEPLFHLSHGLKYEIWNPEVTASMFASDRFTIPTLVARQIPVRLSFPVVSRSARHRQDFYFLIHKSLTIKLLESHFVRCKTSASANTFLFF